MRDLTRDFHGKPGMVLRLGDSITYANPGSAYLRYGKGRSAAHMDVCRWMKAGVSDNRAASGCRSPISRAAAASPPPRA
jgi:hypothetical protein